VEGVGGRKHRRPRHQNRRAVRDQGPRVLDLYPTVDRHVNRARPQQGSNLTNFRIYGRDELLAAEARVDRHHQHKVEVVDDVV
jgi:hypothetical protein